MQKPYIICHMMMAADGRIDCSMTEKINGVDEYYLILNALNKPLTVSGRVTAHVETVVLMSRVETLVWMFLRQG